MRLAMKETKFKLSKHTYIIISNSIFLSKPIILCVLFMSFLIPNLLLFKVSTPGEGVSASPPITASYFPCLLP